MENSEAESATDWYLEALRDDKTSIGHRQQATGYREKQKQSFFTTEGAEATDVKIAQGTGYVLLLIGLYASFALFSSTVRNGLVSIYSLYFYPHWKLFAAILALLFTAVFWIYKRQAPGYRLVLTAATRSVEQVKAKLGAASSSLEKQIINNGIRPIITESLNKLKKPAFPPEIPDTETSGLAEMLNTRYEITTPSRHRVVNLMDKIQAGSIGIAGPRGAGKTTLLWTLCEEAAANPKQLSIFVSAPVQYESRDFLVYMFISLCTRIIQKETGSNEPQLWTDFQSIVNRGRSFSERLRKFLIRRQNDDEERDSALLKQEPRKYELVSEARRILRGLRFQQSFSAGWSGALKLHVAETGMNAAVQLAQRQLSLPELVGEYRRFLAKATSRYNRVVIAIDELDKLESDDAAQKFVNGIKAIFGQPKVFYMLSISENAMNSFERRGLPFRDAFDSAFDDMVKVDYLDSKASQRLILRRLYPAPSPVYMGFCHVLAGGLPRDVIRQCRRLYEYRRANTGKSYLETCEAIIAEDVSAKLSASRSTIPRFEGDSCLTEVIAALATPPANSSELLATIGSLHREFITILNRQDSANSAKSFNGDIENLKSLARLHEEFISYLYLTVTISELFAHSIDSQNWDELVSKGALEQLARARQWMAVDLSAPIKIVTELRRKFNLAVPASFQSTVTETDVTETARSAVATAGPR